MLIAQIGRPLQAVCIIAISCLAGCSMEWMREADPHRQVEAVSLLSQPLYALPPGETRALLERELREAQRDYRDQPNDPELLVWVGRRWGYLWEINEAIDAYSRGIQQFGDYVPFYRHRGHRYITARRFPEALADLEWAAVLIETRRDGVEQDGAPNERNIPLTTTAFNVWYHLGLAKYLMRDFAGAAQAFRRAQQLGRGFDDNLVATSDWIYMALRRAGRNEEAARVLDRIDVDMDLIENQAYHRRLLMYKGLITPEELIDLDSASDLDLATLGYGLGNWYYYNGHVERARDIFLRVVDGPYWPAFGYIAAEVDLAGTPKWRGRNHPREPEVTSVWHEIEDR